ncbi:MAG: hypothetical protein RL095_566 [Verrucomicrobiota bacterium]
MKLWIVCGFLASGALSLSAAPEAYKASAPAALGEEKLTPQKVPVQGIQLEYRVWLPKGYFSDRRLHGLLLVEDPNETTPHWEQIQAFARTQEMLVVYMKTGLTQKKEMPNLIAAELSRRYRLADRSGILISATKERGGEDLDQVKSPFWTRLVGAYLQEERRDFFDPSADFAWVCKDLKQWIHVSLTSHAAVEDILKNLIGDEGLPESKPEHVLVTMLTPAFAQEDPLPLMLTQLLRRRCEDPLANSVWAAGCLERQVGLLADKDPQTRARAWSCLAPLPASTSLSRNVPLQEKMKKAREDFLFRQKKDAVLLAESRKVEVLSAFVMKNTLEENLKKAIADLEAKLKVNPEQALLKQRLQDLQALLRQWENEGEELIKNILESRIEL